MDKAALAFALAAVMRRCVGGGGEVAGLARLSGGATMESWSFDYGDLGYVLRRAPSLAMMEGRPFGHDVEAALVQAAFASGVKAPEVSAVLLPQDDIGSGYIMRRAEGEVQPALILAAPPTALIKEISAELAKIHAITPRADIAIPVMDTSAALADLKSRFLDYGGDRPIIALAIRWCEDNLPPASPPVLVHGDFRMGNLMVDASGISAVLDWELAHWGDRHDDIAYGCLTVWRFGHLEKPAYGLASLSDFFVAYEAAGGEFVDPARFHFWMIYRTLWWALGCLQMAEFWRSGTDRSLERAVIGRRTSENELDLLMLMESGVECASDVSALTDGITYPDFTRTRGEPSATEMLEAVREWIGSDVKAKSTGREKFLAAVAMNAIAMVQRELTNPVSPHDPELSQSILAGDIALNAQGLLAKLRRNALDKLTNDVPKYASLKSAQQKWSDVDVI
jgi:aminoglycoside phosphotransferase (APT) family kinase protein